MISVTLHNFTICFNITQNFMNIFWQKDLCICFMSALLQCTDPGHITEFDVMVPDIFSTLLKFFLLHTEMCTSTHVLSRKHQITVWFTGHSWMWGSQVTLELEYQVWNLLMSSFQHLEFGDGSWIFRKYDDICLKVIMATNCIWFHFISQVENPKSKLSWTQAKNALN